MKHIYTTSILVCLKKRTDRRPKTGVFSFPTRPCQWRVAGIGYTVKWLCLVMNDLSCVLIVICFAPFSSSQPHLGNLLSKKKAGESPGCSASGLGLLSWNHLLSETDKMHFLFLLNKMFLHFTYFKTLVLYSDIVKTNTGPLGVGPTSSYIGHILLLCVLFVYLLQKILGFRDFSSFDLMSQMICIPLSSLATFLSFFP